MQHLVARARWDADGVRDDLREFVVRPLDDRAAARVTAWHSQRAPLFVPAAEQHPAPALAQGRGLVAAYAPGLGSRTGACCVKNLSPPMSALFVM